jgi:hypothetical protein
MMTDSSLVRRSPNLAANGKTAVEEMRSRGTRVHPGSLDAQERPYEPSLAELLSDPIARALMRADGVIAEDVIAVIDRLRARITAARDPQWRRVAHAR